MHDLDIGTVLVTSSGAVRSKVAGEFCGGCARDPAIFPFDSIVCSVELTPVSTAVSLRLRSASADPSVIYNLPLASWTLDKLEN